MLPYNQFKPTQFDHNIPIEGKQQWLVLPFGRNRDSGCLDESNFHTAVAMLRAQGGEYEEWEIIRQGHWACGWFEIIIVKGDTAAHKVALQIESELDNYPILDPDDMSEREEQEANLTWTNCYNNAQRLEYVRKHRRQFQFHSFADMVGCIKGKYYNGDVSAMCGN